MNAASVPFRLLIINDSLDEAQRLISMFQNAGKPCRAQHINSQEGFNKIIEEQSWDLAIVNNETTEPTPAYVIQEIRKHNTDLPIIILTDINAGGEAKTDRSVIDGMKLGACDVVTLDDDQHLLLVVNRELNNRQARKDTRAAERKVHELEQRNRALLNSSKDGIAFVQDGMIIYANDSFAEKAGYSSRSDIEYAPLMDLIDPANQQRVKVSLKNFLIKNKDEEHNSLTFLIKGPDENYNEIECDLQIDEFEDETCIQLLSSSTIADSEELEAEINNIKNTDLVTGLNNKVLFHEKLCSLINDASTNETSYSFFYIDIDQFKAKIESIVGINGANEALKTIAELLNTHCPKDNFLARISDHSFAVLSTKTHIDNLLALANKICDNIREHFFEIQNKTLRLTCSIGISIINETNISPQAVINQTSKAIEELRKPHDGLIGDGVNIFQNQNEDKTVLVSSLQKALNNNDFKILFQPIISLRGDETERYEVLLRMLNESGEEVSPDHFLKTAETMQIMNKIDRWVILEAIKHLSHANKNKLSKPQLIVNISHHSLCDEALLPWLQVAFKAAKVDPSSLMLQAKESDVTQYLTAAKTFIDQAASIGVTFSINQFGCSLDPLSLLDHISVDHIKIDGSFSIDLQENEGSTEIMSALLKSLHERGRITTIPFVENAAILSKLWKMGAHCIQGHYLQPPSMAMDYEFSVEGTG